MIEAMKQALEALEDLRVRHVKQSMAITILRQAIAEAEQEPVRCMTIDEIRAYFEAKGVSQREVGRFIEVDTRTVRGWFAGKTPWPHLFTLAVQADIFGVEEHPNERVSKRLVLRRAQ